MLLRRIIEHVRTQNWTAVGIDFVIVVVGVFMGIQLGNWNEARALRAHERILLGELHDETRRNIADAKAKSDAFLMGAASGRRILAMAEDDAPSCTENCWAAVVDLMHASQWQQINVSWPTYDELRRQGLPSDRTIIPLIAELQFITFQATNALAAPPPYRALVRRAIPIGLQDAYWDHCYVLDEGIEHYIYPCQRPDSVSVSSEVITAVLADTETMAALREWTSVARIVGAALGEVSESDGAILSVINQARGVP